MHFSTESESVRAGKNGLEREKGNEWVKGTERGSILIYEIKIFIVGHLC